MNYQPLFVSQQLPMNLMEPRPYSIRAWLSASRSLLIPVSCTAWIVWRTGLGLVHERDAGGDCGARGCGGDDAGCGGCSHHDPWCSLLKGHLLCPVHLRWDRLGCPSHHCDRGGHLKFLGMEVSVVVYASV